MTISTGWSNACSTVTVGSTNGWDTNFDNFVAANPVTATPTATPPSGSTTTVNFDNLSNPNRTLNGQYPSGVINWGNNRWYLSGPYGAFTTNSVGFNGAGPTSASFTFVNARRLVRVDAYNGDSSATTVTLSCAGQPTVTVSIPARTLRTVTTNWSGTCTSVTVGSSNGWETNFDNFVVQ
jgi:hypothetical protein